MSLSADPATALATGFLSPVARASTRILMIGSSARKRPVKPLTDLRHSAKLDPKNFPARNALGRALLGVDQVNRVVAQPEYGIKLAPESPDMQFALSQAYPRAGRMQDAERARGTAPVGRAADSGTEL